MIQRRSMRPDIGTGFGEIADLAVLGHHTGSQPYAAQHARRATTAAASPALATMPAACGRGLKFSPAQRHPRDGERPKTAAPNPGAATLADLRSPRRSSSRRHEKPRERPTTAGQAEGSAAHRTFYRSAFRTQAAALGAPVSPPPGRSSPKVGSGAGRAAAAMRLRTEVLDGRRSAEPDRRGVSAMQAASATRPHTVSGAGRRHVWHVPNEVTIDLPEELATPDRSRRPPGAVASLKQTARPATAGAGSSRARAIAAAAAAAADPRALAVSGRTWTASPASPPREPQRTLSPGSRPRSPPSAVTPRSLRAPFGGITVAVPESARVPIAFSDGAAFSLDPWDTQEATPGEGVALELAQDGGDAWAMPGLVKRAVDVVAAAEPGLTLGHKHGPSAAAFSHALLTECAALSKELGVDTEEVLREIVAEGEASGHGALLGSPDSNSPLTAMRRLLRRSYGSQGNYPGGVPHATLPPRDLPSPASPRRRPARSAGESPGGFGGGVERQRRRRADRGAARRPVPAVAALALRRPLPEPPRHDMKGVRTSAVDANATDIVVSTCVSLV
ncbi:unnamed protein product [Pedinophyceae sp. YPF-701]|nr:unnamed protein product [Pedinophyceae sp. YPF-701]